MTVQGTLTDAGTGLPIPNVPVTFQPQLYSGPGPSTTVVTDAAGDYAVSVPVSVAQHVSVDAPSAAYAVRHVDLTREFEQNATLNFTMPSLHFDNATCGAAQAGNCTLHVTAAGTTPGNTVNFQLVNVATGDTVLAVTNAQGASLDVNVIAPYPPAGQYQLRMIEPDLPNIEVQTTSTITVPAVHGMVLLPQPERLVDTRTLGPIPAAGSRSCYTVTGNGVPADAVGVAVNLTSTGASDYGWLTLFPSGQPVPDTSTVNFDRNAYAIANNSIVGVGPDGRVCVNVGHAASQIIIDVVGYVPSGNNEIVLLRKPQRIMDTRLLQHAAPGLQPICAHALDTIYGGPRDPVVDASIGGAAGLIVNITATGYTDQGWLTALPESTGLPTTTSTVNYDGNTYAIANGAIIASNPIRSDTLCVMPEHAASHVVVDLTGLVMKNGPHTHMLSAPVRLADTRTTGPAKPAGSTPCFSLAGQSAIPSTASGLIVNLTSVGALDLGWLTLFPSHLSLPPTSSLNFDPRAYAIANGALVKLGPDGQYCVNVGHAASQIIVDATGYLTPDVATP